MSASVRCPACGEDVVPKPIRFTWWGGAVGPRLLSHVSCPACYAKFNGRTGKFNGAGIAIYVGVLLLLTLAFVLARAWSR